LVIDDAFPRDDIDRLVSVASEIDLEERHYGHRV